MSDCGASTDEALVAAYRASGEEAAVEELVRRHLPRVRAMVYPMVLDDAVADDLTQETFLRALRGLGGFDGRSKFATWLARVALNTTYSFLRGRGRSPVDYRAAVPEPQGLAPPDGPALEAEQHARIEAALAGLSPKLRAAVVLVDLGGTEVKEAARIEGCTAATMYWRIHEARKRLRRKLERYVSP